MTLKLKKDGCYDWRNIIGIRHKVSGSKALRSPQAGSNIHTHLLSLASFTHAPIRNAVLPTPSAAVCREPVTAGQVCCLSLNNNTKSFYITEQYSNGLFIYAVLVLIGRNICTVSASCLDILTSNHILCSHDMSPFSKRCCQAPVCLQMLWLYTQTHISLKLIVTASGKLIQLRLERLHKHHNHHRESLFIRRLLNVRKHDVTVYGIFEGLYFKIHR